MNEYRLYDYKKIIKNNGYIQKMYKRLAELDYSNQKESEEYNTIIELIKELAHENETIYKSYSLYDDDILNFVDLIDEVVSNTDFEFLNYFRKDNESYNKLARFAEFYGYFNIHNKDIKKEDLTSEFDNSSVNFNGVIYSMDNLLEILDEYGYKSFKERIEQIREIVAQNNYNQLMIANQKLAIIDGLQNHTMIEYFDKEINETNDKRIKKKLINAKYILISIYKELEDPFLIDQNNYSKVSYYQNNFKKMITKDDMEFQLFNKDYIKTLNDIIIKITERKKEKYNNINDKFEDILTSIYLKTYTSLLGDKKDILNILVSENYLLSENKNEINKNILMHARNLEPNLILLRKL